MASLPSWEWITPPKPHSPATSIASDSSRTLRAESEPGIIEIDPLEPSSTPTGECIDLTIDDDEAVHHALLQPHERALSQLCIGGHVYRRGDFVEIVPIPVLHRRTTKGSLSAHFDLLAEFVQVQTIIQPTDGVEPLLRGVPYVRSRNLDNKLPKKLNEVCLISHSDQPSHAPVHPPTLIDVAQSAVVKRRRLITTNALWPDHNPNRSNYTHIRDRAERKKQRQDRGPLVCRWKYELYPLEAHARITSNAKMEEVIRRLRGDEVPHPRYRVANEDLLASWRPGTIRGGSYVPHPPPAGSPEPSQRLRGQKFTLFDSFCGAGGVSRGAQMAGLRPCAAIDSNEDACRSYARNFPDSHLLRQPIADLVQSAALQRRLAAAGKIPPIDVLHLSPPCQYLSPAHTRAAAHDEANIDALKCCDALLRLCRPRLVTLEQTFGITHDRHAAYWESLLSDFTALGFSLRWRVVPLEGWGAAQTRRRLILVAAAPGEALPTLPRRAYGAEEGTAVRPYETVATALRRAEAIPPGEDPLHDLAAVARHDPPKPPYDPSRLSGTITTSGGDRQWHPSGRRNLTLREIACIQGFPLRHAFEGGKSSVCRQIGNAFPPRTVAFLMRHLEAWLLASDGMGRARVESVAVGRGREGRHARQLPTPPATHVGRAGKRRRGEHAETTPSSPDARQGQRRGWGVEEDVVMLDAGEAALRSTVVIDLS